MKLEELTSIDQLTDFLAGTQAVAFSALSDKDAHYMRLPRQGQGVALRYLMRISVRMWRLSVVRGLKRPLALLPEPSSCISRGARWWPTACAQARNALTIPRRP